jgi:hypothetical protein
MVLVCSLVQVEEEPLPAQIDLRIAPLIHGCLQPLPELSGQLHEAAVVFLLVRPHSLQRGRIEAIYNPDPGMEPN